ncbi:putative transcriptional regulator, BolA superfamily [Candidatus Regiella insecticola 5.15]|uniref:Putative transcriptional regulator, BolA superfamily n=1 Tax=Candidatus Regiella insecticola 5.15 TaxID=1005043 RepID=G2GXZ6_9ENTR|nr:putative transcriptional regulator, BolA superfamily [Candidatus Regiella insecticola 5.15]
MNIIIDAAKVKGLLMQAEALSLQEAHVSVEGSHFQVTVISEVFTDMNLRQKHQAVYTVLAEYIAKGSMHAVSIKAYTPQEWQRDRKLNGF